MAHFAYRGRDSRGVLREGVLEGQDAGAVADQLSGAGVTPVHIAPVSARAAGASAVRRADAGAAGAVAGAGTAGAANSAVGSAGSAAGAAVIHGPARTLWQRLHQARVGTLDVQLFSRQMYTLLKSGVPLMRGLAGLQASSVNPRFARVIGELRESLDAGRELSNAMRRHPECFSHFYLAMIRVGEMTGRLEQVFLRLHAHLEFDRDMRARVQSALRYPLFVVLAMLVAMAVINLFVIPQFVTVFARFGAVLPLMTRVLIGASSFTVRYWPLLLALAAALLLACRAWHATPAGRLAWDRYKLRIPVAGKIVHKGTMARFARSFALSMQSGVPIVQALTVVAQTVDNAYLAGRIEQMRDGVERGETILRTASAADVFTPLVLQMVAVGEETGALDELMEEIAQMYEREVDYALKTLSSQIEPILICVLGALVLVLALGIFLPLWDLGRVTLHKA